MLDYLLDEDPYALADLWKKTLARGPGWNSRLEEGWRAANRRYPEQAFAQRLNAALET